MTLDWEIPDTIVLGKDLKPGDCIRAEIESHDMGIIIATTFVEDERGKELKRFYENEPAIERYDINCPSDGPYTGHLKPEKEFFVINSRKDILYTYKEIEYQLLERSADLMNQRNDLMEIRSIAFDRLGDKLNKLKKE